VRHQGACCPPPSSLVAPVANPSRQNARARAHTRARARTHTRTHTGQGGRTCQAWGGANHSPSQCWIPSTGVRAGRGSDVAPMVMLGGVCLTVVADVCEVVLSAAEGMRDPVRGARGDVVDEELAITVRERDACREGVPWGQAGGMGSAGGPLRRTLCGACASAYANASAHAACGGLCSVCGAV